MDTHFQTFHNDLTSSPACDKIKTNRRRFLCPACGRHTVLFLLPTTEVKDLPVKCKRCGKESVVNISSAPEP
ncbi:MAG: cysteine-rich KTR domain-containing protein [Faecousia sp.]